MKIVVTGATGFVGSALVPALRAAGHAVTVLSRNAAKAKAALGEVTAVDANLEEPGPWTAALADAHAVLHLAGESVGARRWNARQKQVVRDSRVESTRTLVEAIASLPAASRPKALVSASGTDYYPFAVDTDGFDDDPVPETDAPGESFLARVCRDWEKQALAAEAHGVRVVLMRTGLVLGPGGALDKLTTPFKFFVGGRIGHGRQFMPWIHRDDVVAGYVAAATDERYRGPINLVRGSVRNAEFSKALGHALGRPSWLPVPGFAVKMAAGEFAEYVLNGRNVVPAKLTELGFTWKYATVDAALAAL